MISPAFGARVAAWSAAAALLVDAAPLGAQSPSPPPAFRFEHLRAEDGLSQNSVEDLLQDRRGFMWFGTHDGLNRYDGHRVTVYEPNPADATTLGGRFIWALDEDARGRLWVGTDGGGLSRFNAETETFTRYAADASPPRRICSNKIYEVYADPKDNVLWLGTQQNGLCRFDPKTGALRQFTHDPDDPRSLSGNTVHAVLRDSRGRLWVGTTEGLNRLDPDGGGFERFNGDPGDPRSLTHSHIETLFEDSAGRLWVGTYDGLVRWDPASRSFVRTHASDSRAARQLRRSLVSGIAEDRPGVLWIASNGRGLFRLHVENKTLTVHRARATDSGSLSNNELLSMAVDEGGVLWASVAGQGVDRLPPQVQQFHRYQADADNPNALASNIVRSIDETPDGSIWIGLIGGLDRFDPKTGVFTHYRPDAGDSGSLAGRWVRAVADSAGMVWIGMNGAGVDRLDPETETVTHYGADQLTSDRVISMMTDRRGNVWIGTMNGLNRLRPATGDVTQYHAAPDDPHGLANPVIMALCEDESGFIWVGTRGGGLHRLDPRTGRFERYVHDPNDPHSLGHDHVLGIHEGRDGALWVGTRGGGLNRLDRKTGRFEHFTTKDGLPNDVVYGVLEEDGTLWASTNRGLAHLDPAARRVTTYTYSDGLPNDEFNRGALHRGAGGRMYFGGLNGVAAFRPEDVEQTLRAPPVVLTGLDVRGSKKTLPASISTAEEVRLDHDENFFTLRFAALDFSEPSANRYRYRLEGFDKDWVDAGHLPEAFYTGVPPGTYRFQVRGANSDGVWSDATSLVVVVEPAYWQTWWFRLLAVLLVAALLFAAYRYRVYHLREVEGTRRRIARDLHDDLGSRISTLALRADLLSRREHLDPADRDYLAELADETRATVDDLRHLVWLIDTGSDALSALIDRIENVAAQMLEGRPHRIDVPQDPPPATLKVETRRHVLLIFKEALHNAVRHSHADHIAVSVALNDGETLTLRVEDDGRGFACDGKAPDGRATGHGLRSMQERAEALGGTLRVRSAPGEGTSLRLTAKVA